MNELAVSSGYLKPMAEADRAALKTMLLGMYKDIASLCDENNLEYMAGGGTCLGAIRHQGFIPWDDDLDLMMPRSSYEKLIELCKADALGENYEFDAPSKDKDCKNPFLKIYRKNTMDIELQCEDMPFPVGVFIDIFPMDYAPKQRICQRLRAFASDLMMVINTSVLYTQYPSKKYKEFVSLSKEASKRYKLRTIIGSVFGIIQHKRWTWWFDRLHANAKPTEYITIPTGRNHYLKEIQHKGVFLPTKKVKFEGLDMNVPADYDTYLSRLYGDYMSVPPVEKRERHFVYKFSLDTRREE